MIRFLCINRKTGGFAGLMLFLCIFWAGHAMGQTAPPGPQTVVSFGDSRIYNDLASAKKAAVSRGLSSAVQAAAAELISRQELINKFATVAEVLLDQKDTFIQDYRILKEFRSQKHYQVLVQATISMQKLQEAFGRAEIQTAPDQMPAVLLMVAEKNIDDLGFDYWWQRGYGGYTNSTAVSPIRQIFAQQGFTLVEPGSGGDLFSGINPKARPADYEASIIANRLGADLVVVGTAVAEATANRMGEDIRTFRADVNLHVIDAGTGERLTTVREQAITVGKEPAEGTKNAMGDAAYQAGQQLADRLVSLWQNAAQTADKFTINVAGDSVLPYLEDLRSALEKQPGVSGLQTTEMTPTSAALSVDYEGTAQELANNLLVHSFTRFGINIREISAEGMFVELTPE